MSNSKRGENHPSNKLTEKDVRQIDRLLQDGHSQHKIACIFNVSRTTIGDIKNGRTWTHIRF